MVKNEEDKNEMDNLCPEAILEFISRKTVNYKENKYNPQNIASRIIYILPIVRMKGTIKGLEYVLQDEENEILREGYEAIRDNEFGGFYGDENKQVQCITNFVEERCKKYKIEDKKTKIVMITGLYALNGGWNPKRVEQFYNFLENYDPNKIDIEELLRSQKDNQKLLE